MTVSKAYFFNRLIIASGKWNHHRYYAYVKRVKEVQHRKLLHYISDNCDTVYGKEFNFRHVKNYASYASIVPLIEDWNQVNDYIQQIAKGKKNVLCRDEVDAFEETSGSTGFSKLIPYNKALKKEFQKALQVWMIDLYADSPPSFYGRAYWSVSPVLKEAGATEGGIRIGLENDSEYFNPLLGYLFSQIMAVQPYITKIKEPKAFYFETIKQLLLQRNLSFISVWSPTFFLQMDAFLRENFGTLMDEIRMLNPKRYGEVKAAVTANYTWKSIWPCLSCISCWTDAQAAAWMPRLQKIIGEVYIQPKGLLSTEAVISIPIKNTANPALAYQSHFFEFRNVDNYTIHLAHQLIQNECYEVIVTTAGGLYRYVTKDVVQVTGFHCQVPLLKFLGRHNRTSDIVGEKVSEVQVNGVINKIISDGNIPAGMMFIQPQMQEQSGVYILYIEEDVNMSEEQAQQLVKQVEEILCRNPYYQQALHTGQLKAMQYKIISKCFRDRLNDYYRHEKLIKDGNIKLPALFLIHELKDLKHLL